MTKKSVWLLVAILMGITAVIWTVVCVLGFIYGTSVPLLILQVVSTMMWYIVFFVNLGRYRASDDDEGNERSSQRT